MKPYPDFPLYQHRSGQWAKKIRGRTHYFGTDADAALSRYLDVRDDLLAGRTPQPIGLRLRELVNLFLGVKATLVATGDLSPRTFEDYRSAAGRMLGVVGDVGVASMQTSDFERYRRSLASTRGPVALGNELRVARMLLKFAWDEGLIDAPVRTGIALRGPSAKAVRAARHARGPRMFSAEELRQLIDHAPDPLKAHILLGINCGFGQTDIAEMPEIVGEWLDYPRPKTAIARRCPLWPETLAAAEAAGKSLRHTPRGLPWVYYREHPDGRIVKVDRLGAVFTGFARSQGIVGRGFYALRHTFATVAGECRDDPAVDMIMGHADGSIRARYREGIGDDRLLRIVDHVREWLYD